MRYIFGKVAIKGLHLTLMKTVLAEKIPNIRGFMKAEAKGIVEELLEIMKNPFAAWKRCHNYSFWEALRQVQASLA